MAPISKNMCLCASYLIFFFVSLLIKVLTGTVCSTPSQRKAKLVCVPAKSLPNCSTLIKVRPLSDTLINYLCITWHSSHKVQAAVIVDDKTVE